MLNKIVVKKYYYCYYACLSGDIYILICLNEGQVEKTSLGDDILAKPERMRTILPSRE